MTENEFVIRASMNKDYLPLKHEMKNLVLMIEVRARAGTKIKELPKNICFVIDKSSSMEGTKIELAKATVKETIRSLSPFDLVSVVAFSDDVSVVLESSPIKDKELLMSKIEHIELGLATDLYSGIETGLNQLRKSASKERLNKMYILTDGEANVGKTEPEDFRKIALQTKEYGISVDTFGIGADYNEDILNAISNNSMGEWVHISEIPDINKKVMDHVTKLKSVICSSPILKLTPINITRVYDIKRCVPSVREVTNIERKGEIIKFPIGDIDTLESQTFYMRIDTKQVDQMGRHPVINIEIEGNPNSMITKNAIWTDDIDKLRQENVELRFWDRFTKIAQTAIKDPKDKKVEENLTMLKKEFGDDRSLAPYVIKAETNLKSGHTETEIKETKYKFSRILKGCDNYD